MNVPDMSELFHLGPSDLPCSHAVPRGLKKGNSAFSLFCSHNSSPDSQFKSITFEKIMKNYFPFVKSKLKQILFFRLWPET